jgi:hypothetical protein
MKKISLVLAFTFLIGLVWSLEYSSILSVSEESMYVASKDTTLYVGSLNGLSIYNYTNENLELVNTINHDVNMPYNVVYSSGNYLINDNYVTRLYDITDSQSPIEVATLGHAGVNDFIAVDDYLLVRTDGVYVYDTLNFDLPPSQILPYVGKILVVDNCLYVLKLNPENHRELLEYSMELPTDVVLIDSCEINDTGAYAVMAIQNERIFVREKDYLYVFAYSNGLELMETFGPLPPLDNDEYNISTIGNSSTLISADGYYWDISDVNNIVQYQNWHNSGYYYARSKATIIGDYYIKPNEYYGLVIVDMSDIENVQIIYDRSSYLNFVGIEIIDNTLLDVAYPKLKMFDLSDSENIHEILADNNRDWNIYFNNFLSTEDKLLLVNDNNLTILNTENGATNPEFSSSIDLGSIGHIATYNNYFYNVDEESMQVQITDISDPESPEILGNVNLYQTIDSLVNIYIIDHYFLLVNSNRLVAIYDLSNPTIPEYTSSFSINTLLGNQHDTNKAIFKVKDNILYASFFNYFLGGPSYLSDIYIFDITDIENWVLLNTIHDDNEFSNDIEVVGDFLYCVSNLGLHDIHMYQLDGIGGFTEVASYNEPSLIPGQFTDFDVFNNKLYLSLEDLLLVYDIVHYTENDTYEIAPSNEISAYNYPNPFNPETTISYELANKGNVSVDIYNLKGQKVKTLFSESQEAGMHSLVWRGDNDAGKQVSSGTYLYRVRSGNDEIVKKMLIMK